MLRGAETVSHFFFPVFSSRLVRVQTFTAAITPFFVPSVFDSSRRRGLKRPLSWSPLVSPPKRFARSAEDSLLLHRPQNASCSYPAPFFLIPPPWPPSLLVLNPCRSSSLIEGLRFPSTLTSRWIGPPIKAQAFVAEERRFVDSLSTRLRSKFFSHRTAWCFFVFVLNGSFASPSSAKL